MIIVLSFQHAGAFHIVFRRDLLKNFAVGQRRKTIHPVVHQRHHTVPPASEIEIDPAVVILEKMCINGLSAKDKMIQKGLSQISPEGALRIVRNGNFQSSRLFVLLNVVGGKNQIILDYRRCPDRMGHIGKAGHIQNALLGMQFPVLPEPDAV